MLNSFIIVGTNVLIIFVLIIIGFIIGKIKLITDDGVKSMNNIMLYIVSPCVIINSLQRDFDAALLHNLFLSILAAFLSHGISCFIGYLLIHDKDKATQNIKRFAAIYSNCGFMAFPLIEAICGQEGLFYGVGYIIVFNILAWSLGNCRMMEGEKHFEIKKAILNPGVIPSVIGLVMFFTSFSLPKIILGPVEFLAGLNTPLPMLIIGYTISKLDIREYFNIKREWITLTVRLILSPAIVLAILYLIGFRGTLLITTTISASAPVAASTNMFAIKYNSDSALAAKLVSVSALFSIITMTIIVSVAKFLA